MTTVRIDIDRAIYRYQVKKNEKMTYAELARRSGISIQALYRLKSSKTVAPDLRKINAICTVLDCEPGDLIVRHQTGKLSLRSSSDEAQTRH